MGSLRLAVLLAVAGPFACASPDAPGDGAAPAGALVAVSGDRASMSERRGSVVSVADDGDGDGIEDTIEARLAREYLPYLSDDPADACGRSGIVFRARPHPEDPAIVSIVYVRLYEADCGLSGHVGDDEVFGITVDPRVPGPGGIVSMIAIGHQDTVCEQVSACGRCPGEQACTTAMVEGQAAPVVFASRDKHAHYVLRDRCRLISCLDRCALAPPSRDVPLVNAGEPGHPLVEDLTAQGFITRANGWTRAELFNRDPWEPTRAFGGGNSGNVASRLVDASFVPPACGAGRAP